MQIVLAQLMQKMFKTAGICLKTQFSHKKLKDKTHLLGKFIIIQCVLLRGLLKLVYVLLCCRNDRKEEYYKAVSHLLQCYELPSHPRNTLHMPCPLSSCIAEISSKGQAWSYYVS